MSIHAANRSGQQNLRWKTTRRELELPWTRIYSVTAGIFDNPHRRMQFKLRRLKENLDDFEAADKADVDASGILDSIAKCHVEKEN